MSAVHLHARYALKDNTGFIFTGLCDTVCGLDCGSVEVAYRDLDAERVTCAECAANTHRR